jgi:osmoprotectant transport system substrate-binding protein
MHPTLVKASLLLVVAPLALTACGSSSKSATPPASTSGSASAPAATTACTAKPGTKLVLLADDKHAQLSDNVIPIVNTKVAKAPLTDALNGVSAALSQTALLGLNSAVSVDKSTSEDAAKAFVASANLGNGLSGGSGSIVVGAANFAESQTLANVYADVLDKAGYKATVKVSGARALYEPFLEAGQLQVFPEYAATFTTFLATKQKSTVKASTDIATTVATLKPLAAKAGLTALTPAAATDENAFVVTTTTAAAYGLKTLSDIATKCTGGITVGAPPECPKQGFCEQALTGVYGIKITKLLALDEDSTVTRTALKTGKVLLGEVFSSDADVLASAS